MTGYPLIVLLCRLCDRPFRTGHIRDFCPACNRNQADTIGEGSGS